VSVEVTIVARPVQDTANKGKPHVRVYAHTDGSGWVSVQLEEPDRVISFDRDTWRCIVRVMQPVIDSGEP
jgi:hypothetical protein